MTCFNFMRLESAYVTIAMDRHQSFIFCCLHCFICSMSILISTAQSRFTSFSVVHASLPRLADTKLTAFRRRIESWLPKFITPTASSKKEIFFHHEEQRWSHHSTRYKKLIDSVQHNLLQIYLSKLPKNFWEHKDVAKDITVTASQKMNTRKT